MARVAKERTLAAAVEEGPQVVAGAAVPARAGPAVVHSGAAHFHADAGQMEHLIVGTQSLRLLGSGRRVAGNDPLAVHHHVLHAADEEGQSLGEDAEEGRGAA